MSADTVTLPLDNFNGWLAHGERGISSEAIVSQLTGVPISQWRTSSDYPHDPADFRRCQLLLNAVPMARLMFPQMRSRSPQWARLVDAWDEIHVAIEADVPGYLARHTDGNATLGYRLMRRTIAGGVECGGCHGSGNGQPCPKCKGTGRRAGGRCRYSYCHGGHFLCSACRGYGYTGGDR